MFRRIWSRLFPRELGCCFSFLFKSNRFTDEDPEELCGAEVVRGESQPPAILKNGLEESNDPQKTQDSARVLSLHQNEEILHDNYVGLVGKLAAENSVASRIAAGRILYASYERLSPQAKGEMWKILSRLSIEDNIRVRKMVVTILANLAREADTELYTSCIIPVLENLTEGKQAEPCLEATQLVVYISTWPHVPEDARPAIIPVLLKQSRHPSWEVRHMIASNINKIQEALREHIFSSGLLAVLPNLMTDYDSRVRDAADNQFLESCTYSTEARDKSWL